MEYVAVVRLQIPVGPFITPGTAGTVVTTNVRTALPEQLLLAFTDNVPELNVEAKFTVSVVPVVVTGDAPAADVTPAGSVQV